MTSERDLKAILSRNARAKVFGYSVIVYKLENGRLIADRVELGYGELQNILYIGAVFDVVSLDFDIPKEIKTIHIGEDTVEVIQRYVPLVVESAIREVMRDEERGEVFVSPLKDMYGQFGAKYMGGIRKLIASTVQDYEKLKRNPFLYELDLELHTGGNVAEKRWGEISRCGKREGINSMYLYFFKYLAQYVFYRYFAWVQFDLSAGLGGQTPAMESYLYEKFFEIAWKVIDRNTKETGDIAVFLGEFFLEMLNYGERKISEADIAWYRQVIWEKIVPALSKPDSDYTSYMDMKGFMKYVWYNTVDVKIQEQSARSSFERLCKGLAISK